MTDLSRQRDLLCRTCPVLPLSSFVSTIQYLDSRLAYIEKVHSGTITSHIKVILHPSVLLESQLTQIEPPEIPETDHSTRFEHLLFQSAQVLLGTHKTHLCDIRYRSFPLIRMQRRKDID